MTNNIQIAIRSVYGNELIYPICSNADCFAAIARKKTFSFDDLTQIHNLGYSIEIVDGKSTKAGQVITHRICS